MAASTVAIARMPWSKISRPDTGLRRPHCARRLADEDAASAAAEEDVVEHVTVAHVHAGGPACAVPCLTWARFVSRLLVGHRPVSDGTPTAGRRSDMAPVGVRNSDQVLDLRLRNATAQTCQHLLGARDAGIRASVPLPWGRTALEGMRATRPDLRASDSGLSTFGSRDGRAGPRAGAIAHLWAGASSDDAAGHKGDRSF